MKDKLGVANLVQIVPHYSPLEAVFLGALNVCGGIVPTVYLLATSKFIDSAISFSKNGSGKNSIFLFIFIMVICTAYMWLYPLLVELIATKLENNLRKSFRIDLTTNIASVRYDYIENQESMDLISRVCREPEARASQSYQRMLSAFGLILKIGGIMVILFLRVWWATLVVAGIAALVFMVAMKGGEENYEAERLAEKHNRKAHYLSEVLQGRDAVHERTIFDYSEKVNEWWHSQYETARKIKLSASLKWLKESEISGILTSLMILGIILVLVVPLKNGALSIGLYISIINSIIALIPDLSWELPEYTEAIAEDKEYLSDLSGLLKLQHNKEWLSTPSSKVSDVESIEFRNVTFSYPGLCRDVLKNVSFLMEKGKHYAIVGANGSGKTTITKLLTGLYNDFSGQILINGIPIGAYSSSELKSMFAIVYQDFAKYGISLFDNIAIGNVNNFDEDKVYEAINEMELSSLIESLPEGVLTSLGRISEGSVDLSGGQWQRIATARALVSNASVRILDEPTAALDPISESKLYENFEKINKGKTTILISHRLASTKLADVIFVFDDGSIVEQGNYEKLMSMDGIYSTMFNSQRSWYIYGTEE
ncbi:ABC transporter ATP-binding protein [Coprothermobacter platensis]|uniref:ABC transporter ATP-binding protein n=1 Tax=Coprothermobacter platensis TaxID=108819 RepID=UPI0003A0D5F0|nr:ABC transporter ATP-binding protein [Coprothermobacter platensis]